MLLQSPVHRLPLLLDALDRAEVDALADDDGIHARMSEDQRQEVIDELGELAAEIDGLLSRIVDGAEEDEDEDEDELFAWWGRADEMDDIISDRQLDTYCD